MTMHEYDPFSYELDQDPYPTYRWMRDHAPAYRNERLDFWAFTRFQDNYDALVDPVTYSSSHGTSLEFMDTPKPGTGLMIWMDPPRHTRYRKLVSKAFTPAKIGELEPMIRRIALRVPRPAGRAPALRRGEGLHRAPPDGRDQHACSASPRPTGSRCSAART